MMKSASLRDYFRPRWSVLGLLVYCLVMLVITIEVVHAATTADGGTTVSAGGWYIFAEPYILEICSVIVTGLLGWAFTWFRAKTGYQIDDAAIARLNLAARNGAGRILASQEGNVAKLKFDVGNPWIAAEAQKLQVVMKDEIKQLGWTPSYAAVRLQDLVHAKIGVLQTSAPPDPIPLKMSE